MKKAILLILTLFAATSAFAQATKNASGNWNDPSKWVGGNIGDQISENVTINRNSSTTILANENYTIGNFFINDSNTLTIQEGAVLTIGNIGNPKNFTALVQDEDNFNPVVLNINGALIISGDMNLEAFTRIDINVSSKGSLIVHGGVNYSESVFASFKVSGGKVIIHKDIKYPSSWVYSEFNFEVLPGIMAINGNVEITGGASLKTCEEYGTENCEYIPPFEEPFCDCKTKPGVFLISGNCDGGLNRYFCDYSDISPWVANDIGVERIISPGPDDITSLTPSIEVMNYGTNSVTSARINLLQNGIEVETKDFPVSLGLFEKATLTFSPRMVPAGNYTFGFDNVLTNGVPDGNPSNSKPVVQSKINKQNQSITFNALSAKTYGDAVFNLNASSSAALPVSYTSSNTNVATINGSAVTIQGAGTTTITAIQNGNEFFNQASNVQRTLTVNKANQSITFNTIEPRQLGSAPFELTASSSSGLPLSFTSSNHAVATVSGNTVTINGNGTTLITALQGGNSNYNAATSVSRELVVSTITSVDGPVSVISEVYPNPVKSELVVVVRGIIKERISEVTFHDLMGRSFAVALEPSSDPDKYTCNLENFKAGLYFISLSGQKTRKKVIKID